jgi:hypothetical protein
VVAEERKAALVCLDCEGQYDDDEFDDYDEEEADE